MSRLESDSFNSTEVIITNQPQVEIPSRPLARPMESRRSAIEEFDIETKMQQNQVATLGAVSAESATMLGMAECLIRTGQQEEAIKYLRVAHQLDPRAHTAAKLGDSLYEMARHEEAREFYIEAIRMGLHDGEELFRTYKNLGNISTLQNDLAAAEENYNKAFTLNPDSDVLMVNYGSLEIQRGDLNKAVEKFRHAVALNASNDRAWVGLALIHREFGDIELAWANLERALDANNLNDTAIRLVAEWAIKDNENERAVRHLEEYVSIRTQDAQMTMWLAKFLFLSGRLNQAEIEINKALDIDPILLGAAEVLSVITGERAQRELK